MGNGLGEGIVGKWIRGGDCGQRDVGRGLWAKGRRERTV